MITKFLKHPSTSFLAILLGVIFGIYFPENAKNMKDFGSTYILLIQMTIVPILVSAIIAGVGRFIQDPKFVDILSRALKAIAVAMIITVTLALSLSFVLKPGSLSKEGSDFLSVYIGDQIDILSVNLDEQGTKYEGKSLIGTFFESLIPANFFKALAEGETLSLAFFSILVGIAAGFYQMRCVKIHRKEDDKDNQKTLFSSRELLFLCDNTFAVFQIIISIVLIILPVALVFITAGMVAENGLGVFAAAIRLIISFYILSFLFLLLGTLFLSLTSKISFMKALRMTLKPAFLGFVTRTSMATIPAAIDSLRKEINMDGGLAKLLVSLFFVLFRYGNLIYFSVVTVFSLQIYQIDFGVTEIIVLILGLIFASIATAGASGFCHLKRNFYCFHASRYTYRNNFDYFICN